MGVHIEADMRLAIFAHMQKLGFSFYDKNRTGLLMSRVTTDLFDITELAHRPGGSVHLHRDADRLVPRPLEHPEEAGARADGRRADDPSCSSRCADAT